MLCLAIIPVGAYISVAFPIPWHLVEDHVKCFQSGPYGGTAEIRVEASSPGCSFSVGSTYPWITVSQAKGGPGVVTVLVEGNTGLQHRVGSVRIDGTEGDVVQEGPVITGGW
jgi:hypothetical protein